MDEYSGPPRWTFEKACRAYDKVVPESVSGVGIICIVVGLVFAVSAVVVNHHAAIFLLGGSFLVIVGVARQVKKLSAHTDREFFGGG